MVYALFSLIGIQYREVINSEPVFIRKDVRIMLMKTGSQYIAAYNRYIRHKQIGESL